MRSSGEAARNPRGTPAAAILAVLMSAERAPNSVNLAAGIRIRCVTVEV